MTYAQIEQALVEAIKSMILENSKQLTPQNVSDQVKYLRKMLRKR
ncbi:MAG: hypothetical protein R3C53_14805 [Pirellulaceae bacterium]